MPDHLQTLDRIERISLEDVPARMKEEFDGVIILPESLVGTREIEDLVIRPGVWSIVTVGRDE